MKLSAEDARRRLLEAQRFLVKRREWSPPEVAAAISKDLGLGKAQGEALQETLWVIGGFKDEFDRLDDKLGSYARYRDGLKRIDKLLTKLRREVSNIRVGIDHFLSDDIQESFRNLTSGLPTADNSRGESMWTREMRDELGGLFTSLVEWHLAGASVSFYSRVIEALQEPVKRHVAKNKDDNRGGNPGKLFRDLILEQLSKRSEQIIGKRASASITRPKRATSFYDLCDTTLRHLGVDDRGLAQAIARKIKELDEREKERKKNRKQAQPRRERRR